MKRPKLSGLHLWEIDGRYYVLTRLKTAKAAIKKGGKLGAKCLKVIHLGSIDA